MNPIVQPGQCIWPERLRLRCDDLLRTARAVLSGGHLKLHLVLRYEDDYPCSEIGKFVLANSVLYARGRSLGT
jgi:hypothetical protein